MAAIANGRQLDNTGTFQQFTGDFLWHTILTAAASNFVAGGKYLVLVGISNLQSDQFGDRVSARLAHDDAVGAVELEAAADNILLEDGTGVLLLEGNPVEFPRSVLTMAPVALADTSGLQYVWSTVYTQPTPAEPLVLQVKTTVLTTIVSAGPPFTIQWIRLDDDLVEDTDWFYAESSTDDALSTSFETRASISVDPPSAGDDWLLIATHQHNANIITVNVNTRLVSDPSGSPTQLGGLWEDEARATGDEKVRTHFWVVDNHSDAAVTYAIQDQVESGTAPVHLESAIFALNLSKFAQSAFAFDADAIADVASYTDITPDGWANPTVGTTGDWWVLGQFIDDVAAVSGGTRPRLTVDAADEPWDHTAGKQVYTAEATAALGALVVTRPTLTAGARDINLEAIAVFDTAGVWRDRFLVAWSMELASGAEQGQGAVAVAVAISGTGHAANKGSASVAIAIAFAATGEVTHKGQASVASTVTISGTGHALKEGSAVVAVAVAISASGTPVHKGQSDIPVAVAISATGTPVHKAQADVPVAVAISGTGHALKSGTADAPVAVSIAATGEVTHKAQASIAVGVAIQATGVRVGEGAADVPVNVAISATGTPTHKAVAAVAVGVAFSATGHAIKEGSAAVASAVAISASGTPIHKGQADVPVNVSVSATGQRVATETATVAVAVAIGATGEATHKGQADLPVNVAVSATGQVQGGPLLGTGAIDVAVAFVASGHAIKEGQAAVPVTVLIVATGKAVHKAQAAIAIAVAIVGTGTSTNQGQATVVVGVLISATGQAIHLGQAAVLVGVSISGTGLVPSLLILKSASSSVGGPSASSTVGPGDASSLVGALAVASSTNGGSASSEVDGPLVSSKVI